ncbi:MAG: hypothetical protein E7K04_00455 [Helicobacter sp.]|nr:hypothetical protein [Helicobacter sp.]
MAKTSKKQKNIEIQDKKAKKAGEIESQKPSWRFSKMDKEYMSLEKTEEETLRIILSALKSLESQTWNEIKQSISKNGRKSHFIAVKDLCKEAQDRFNAMKLPEISDDEIFSLRLAGKIRVFGLFLGSIFNIIWIDPNHEICPSHKKGT